MLEKRAAGSAEACFADNMWFHMSPALETKQSHSIYREFMKLLDLNFNLT